MENFVYETPTKVYFGKEEELNVGKIIAGYAPKKVLVHFGGQSARKSGLLDRVEKALEAEGIAYVELGGVTANPELKLVRDRYPILGLPIIRGVVTFLDSMVKGIKALMFSADYFPDDESAQPSKLDTWLEKHVPAEKLQSVLVGVSLVLSLGLTLLLFMLLPTFVAGLFHAQSALVHNLIEGVIKIAIFLAYLILCSKQKDVHRVFQYHGAEHKTIACYEAGLPLTVENIRRQSRFHPRCGTSFMILVIIISIFLYAVLPWTSTGLRIVYKLCMFPLLVGVCYEILKWAGRSHSVLSRIVSQPGLWMQRLTTFEPDDSMIEVAIAAVTPVLPENQEEARW